MTDREKFLERWLGRLRGSAQQAIVRYADTASDAAAEAWAKADDAMVARFGEPRKTTFMMTIPGSLLPPEYTLGDEHLAAIIRADAAMRKWQARAKVADDGCRAMDVVGWATGYTSQVVGADVRIEAPTWPEAVLEADALAEPIWQARESK